HTKPQGRDQSDSRPTAKPDRVAVPKPVHWRYSSQLLQISLNYAQAQSPRCFQLILPALSYSPFYWACNVSRSLIILWSSVRIRVDPPLSKPRTALLFMPES